MPTDIDRQSSNVSIDKSRHAAEAAAPMFIDIDQSVPDIDALYGQLVVVTAFSLNHMKEAMGMIATAQKIMPQVKIIVYDIGLLEEEAIKKVKQFRHTFNNNNNNNNKNNNRIFIATLHLDHCAQQQEAMNNQYI